MAKKRKATPAQSLFERVLQGDPSAVAKVMRDVIKHGGFNAVRGNR